MGHQKIQKEQKEKDDQKINSRYFDARRVSFYRLISQSEENKLARARDTTGDGVSYSGSTTILTPPELKEKRKGTKELREKNAHTYARVLSLQHCFSVTAKEARF